MGSSSCPKKIAYLEFVCLSISPSNTCRNNHKVPKSTNKVFFGITEIKNKVLHRRLVIDFNDYMVIYYWFPEFQFTLNQNNLFLWQPKFHFFLIGVKNSSPPWTKITCFYDNQNSILFSLYYTVFEDIHLDLIFN